MIPQDRYLTISGDRFYCIDDLPFLIQMLHALPGERGLDDATGQVYRQWGR